MAQTIRELLDATRKWFEQRGIESARIDAELLLADALGEPRMALYLDRDRPLKEEEITAYRERVKRRGQFEPVAYILGEREFYGRAFKVSPAVLIPRPDTETVVEVCLEHLASDTAQTVIDVGTGSGCIAITLACERPKATVIGIDISEDALEIARQNAKALGVEDRCTFIRGDLLGGEVINAIARNGIGPKDAAVVVSNPPYVSDAQMKTLMRDVRDHEPDLALRGKDEDGLGHYRTLIAQAEPMVADAGALIVEIGFDQGGGISAIVPGRLSAAKVSKDLGGNDRVAVLLGPSAQRDELDPVTVEPVQDPIAAAMAFVEEEVAQEGAADSEGGDDVLPEWKPDGE